MAAYHAEYPCDLAKPSQVISIPHVFAMGDNESHTFTALVYDSDNPRCGLMAGSVSGVVVTPAGGTVPLLGTKESEVREITLPSGQTAQATACTITLIQGCFAYAGQIVIVIRLVDGEAQTAVLMARGTVTRSLTETIVDPGEVVSDISTLVANAEQAAEDAQTALAQASAVVSYADQSSEEHSEADKAQARANIGAAGVDTTEIFCDINGRIIQRESGATTVPIDAETGRPTTTPWASAKSYTGECAEGDQYVFFGRARSDVRLGFMFIAADGTILVSYAKTSADDFTLYTAPAGTAFVYFLKTNSGAGDANRLWKVEYISPVVEVLMNRVAALEGGGTALLMSAAPMMLSAPLDTEETDNSAETE